jgi:O-Antigen ligase
MKINNSNFNTVKTKKSNISNKPAWISIFLLILVLGLAIISGVAPILILSFHVGPLLVAFFLFRRYPVYYFNFTLWMWFISPLIARIATHKLGYMIPGASAMAPTISSFTFVTFIKSIPKIYQKGNSNAFPFILCFGSVLYSSFLRFIRYPLGTSPLNDMGLVMQSLTPITLGFYLYVNWKHYSLYKKTILKSIPWIALFISGYGVIQFLVAPEWDTQFLLNTVGFASYYGLAEPLGIRVWSTMTNPLSFAVNLMAVLVLLNACGGPIRLIASSVGYLAFLLTQSRTGWYTWLLATATTLVSIKARHQLYFFFSILIIILIVAITASQEPFLSLITDRFQTFSNLSEDASAQGRLQQTSVFLNFGLTEFIGQGNGSEPFLHNVIKLPQSGEYGSFLSGYDMGFLQILIAFGWLGAVPYISGLVILTSRLFLSFPVKNDLFAISARSIVFASIIRVLTTNIVWGEFALPIWICAGISISALEFYSAKP